MGMSDLIFWWMPLAILLVLAGVFVVRRFYRDFPFFFSYIAFTVLAALARVSVRGSPLLYFWMYWATDAVLGLLALFALNEVLKHLFSIDYAEHWWFRLWLPTTAFGIAVVFLVLPVGRITPYLSTNIVFSFDLGMHCLEVLILLLFVFLDKILVAAYDQYDFGIVRGFGVSALVTILADLLRSHFGKGFTVYFAYAPPLAYIGATLIWLYAFVRKPPSQQKLPITIRELVELLSKEAEVAQKIRSWKIWR